MFVDEVGDEFSKGGLEGGRGYEEAEHEKGRERLGGFKVWGEAMSGGVEWDFEESNGGGRRD